MNFTSDSDVPETQPIKVLHILEATLGGTLRYLENIAEATHDSRIISGIAYGVSRADSRFQPFLERVAAMGWARYPTDMRREISLANDLAAFRQVHKAIVDFAPDVVHCHSSKAGALGRAAMLYRRKGRVRLYSPHALAAPLGSKYLKIERILSRFTDGFIAVSDSERREIADFALAKEADISVVYPSVDAGYFVPYQRDDARRRLGLDSKPLVLSIGRLTAQKNPDAFIEIVKHLHANRPDVSAMWVGSGALEADFHRMVKSAGMEEVIRTADWQHDVRDYIAAADVILSPSRFESFGYIAAEALSMCRAVVASDVTGTRDIMRGRLAKWLYPVESPGRAAELILTLLNSPGEATATGEFGRSEVLQRFSPMTMRASLIESYVGALRNTD
jgi:glycosyltransferase involved in cell wall biosynthesis